MDNFENEYFESLRQLALGFEDKRKELAKSRIKMFAAAIARQLLNEKQEFDLIVGGGNSGLFMTKIAELVFETLNLKLPPVINIPVLRIIDKDQNVEALRNGDFELKSTGKVENMLFVDDEIMRALVAKNCIELILAKRPEIEHLNVTIVAENHFFEWHSFIPKLSVRFFAYSELIQWLNGNISYIIPKNLFNEIKNNIPGVESYPHAMAIIIGGGLKRIETEKPYFDFEIEKKLGNTIESYKEQKEILMNEIRELVSEGIEEFKTGKIRFRF
jgi:hypothetical protein